MSKGKFRNRNCHCGSQKKYKKCCWQKDIALEKLGKRVIVSSKPKSIRYYEG